jgi:acyl-CoA reductase-like NAD-dependent aldehyde dehydrogenase
MATTEMTRQRLVIGGDWTEAQSGGSYEQTFPFTGERVGVAAAAGRGDARAAVEEFTELRWITVQQLPHEYPI